jgi:lipoate synthase
MSKPTIRIHNIETDEVIDREMNDAEFAQYQADQTAEQTRQAELAAQAAAKSALLVKLGITEEEAKLLLG